MSRKLKIVTGLIILLASGLGILALSLNSVVQSLKPQILSFLAGHLKTDVSCGTIEAHLFPNAHVVLGDVKVGTDALNVKSLKLKASLLPLISKKLDVSSIQIVGLSATAKRSKDGTITMGPFSSKPTNPAPATATPPPAATPIDLAVKEILLEDINFKFIDEQPEKPQEISIANIRGEIQGIDLKQKSLRIGLSLRMFGDDENNIKIAGQIADPRSGNIDLKIETLNIALDKIAALLENYGFDSGDLVMDGTTSTRLAIKTAPGGIKTEIDLNATDAQVVYKNLLNKNKGVPVKINTNGLLSVSGAFHADQADLTFGSNQISLPFDFLAPNSPIDFKIKSPKPINLAELGSIFPQAKNFNLGGNLNLDLSGTHKPQTFPNLTGNLNFDGIKGLLPLKPTAPVAGEEDSSASPTISLDSLAGTLIFKDGGFESDKMKIKIAGQLFDAILKAKSFKGDGLMFGIVSPAFELAPLTSALVTPGQANPLTGVVQGFKFSSNYSLPEQVGSALMQITELKLPQASIANLALDLQANANTITLKPTAFEIFSGKINIQGDAYRVPPKNFKFQIDGSGMVINEALPAVHNVLSGTVKTLSLQTNGNLDNPKGSLNGPLVLSIGQGEIKGLNIFGSVMKSLGDVPALGQIIGLPTELLQLAQGSGTAFDEINLNAQIQREHLDISSLTLSHALYNISAQGTTGFDGSMQLTAQFRLSPVLISKLVTKQPKLKLLLDRKGNLVIPVTISKREGSTMIVPDISELGKQALENTAKEAAGQLIKGAVPGDAGKLLNSLF